LNSSDILNIFGGINMVKLSDAAVKELFSGFGTSLRNNFILFTSEKLTISKVEFDWANIRHASGDLDIYLTIIGSADSAVPGEKKYLMRLQCDVAFKNISGLGEAISNKANFRLKSKIDDKKGQFLYNDF
jgi:hypothetical protein